MARFLPCPCSRPTLSPGGLRGLRSWRDQHASQPASRAAFPRAGRAGRSELGGRHSNPGAASSRTPTLPVWTSYTIRRIADNFGVDLSGHWHKCQGNIGILYIGSTRSERHYRSSSLPGASCVEWPQFVLTARRTLRQFGKHVATSWLAFAGVSSAERAQGLPGLDEADLVGAHRGGCESRGGATNARPSGIESATPRPSGVCRCVCVRAGCIGVAFCGSARWSRRRIVQSAKVLYTLAFKVIVA